MYKGNVIGVVVPAYNEEGFVGHVIETVPEYVDRIYVIDDCSTDETWAEILEYAEAVNEDTTPESREADEGAAFDQRVVPIRHQTNRGVGGAIKTGYQRALEDRIDVTAVMGGDGQMDPDILDRIIDPVATGEVDYSKGNRLLSDEHREGMPSFRFLGNRTLSVLTKIASGYWGIADPQNGYTAISLEALEQADIDEMYEFYGYCNDLLVELNTKGLRVADVSMPAVYGDEESSIRYREYVPRVSLMLLSNFFWRLKQKRQSDDSHQFVFCYALGSVLSVVGILAGTLATVARRRNQSVATTLGLTVFGLFFLAVAMVLDRRESSDLNTQIDR